MANWLLLSYKRGAWGNSAVWWGPNFSGYTSRLDDAGRYTEAEAKRIERESPIGHLGVKDAVAVPLAEAEELSHKTVDFGAARDRWPGPIAVPGDS